MTTPLDPLPEPDDQFSEYLAAFDEALAVGETPQADASAPPHLQERLKKAQSCLIRLAQARPNPTLLATSPQPAGSPESTTLGRFRILRELGRGGCGVVFLAHDPQLKREVALKVPLPEILATAESRRRFLREAQAAAQLNHPNVVAVHESGEVGPIAYIAYAYCAGPNLARWLKEQATPVAPGAAASLVLTLARAVHYCHGRGILHRDLKPGNILLTEKPEAGAAAPIRRPLLQYQPMITDFGLARADAISTDRTRTGAIMGTAAYMAPEQARGSLQEIGPHTDVYALGAILFELLGGQPPFPAAGELDALRLVLQEEPPTFAALGRNVHRDLETICRKCLEKQPRRRYASAGDLAADLERFLNGEPIIARPVGPLQRAWRWCRRRPATSSLFGFTLLVSLIFLPGWLWYSMHLAESQRRQQEAEKSAEQERQARLAAEETANTQRYFGLLNRIRQRSSQKPLGWTWAGLSDLAELARIDTPVHDPIELRSEAATLLAGVDVREKTVLTDSFNAYCLAFSHDGRSLAAGQDLATAFLWAPIRVYDAKSGKVKLELTYPLKLVQLPSGRAPDGAICLAFSRDNQYLAVGTRSGWVHCWNLAAGQTKAVSWQADLRRINEIRFHPARPIIYTTAHAGDFIKSWDAATGKELARYEAPKKATLHGFALRKDGKTLAAIVHNRIAYLEADSLRDLEKTRPNDENVGLFSLCYSPDGRFLAVQAEDGIVILLDPDGAEVRRFKTPGAESAHRGGINRLEFSPDGSLLFTASENERDRTLKIWEVASGQLLASLVLGETGPLAFAVHPQGTLLATAANRRIALHEIAGSDVQVFRAQHAWPVQNVAFSPAGNWSACSGEFRSRARVPCHFLSVWQTDPEKLVTLHGRANIDKTSWQPLALAFHPTEPILAADGWAHSIETFGLAEKTSAALSAKEPGPLAFDRTGKKLWAILGEKTVQSWHWPERQSASTWQHASVLATGRDQLLCLAAGRQWLLVGGRDGQVHVLNTHDGKPHASWPAAGVPVHALAISKNEAWAAVGALDGQLRILGLPDGNLLATCRDHPPGVEAIAINPADALMATCSSDNRIHLYALQDQQPHLYATLALPAGPIRGLCFTPPGNQLAFSAGSETALRFWRLDTLQQRLAELGIR